MLDEALAPSQMGRIDHMLRQSATSISEIRAMPNQTAVLPSSAAGRFFTDWIQTQSERVECCPVIFDEALVRCEKIFAALQAEASDTLKMISCRTNDMINSWMHNLPALKCPT